MRLLEQQSLPLLAKELTELAMRRRTYVVRVIYACSLLFVTCLAFRLSVIPAAGLSLNYLGTGNILLWWLGYLQNLGLLVVLPALASDVFTREKERQTIGLLFLTRLSPWTIVLEKFFSRLFPAVCLLLVSLPLLAISYSLGGIELWQILHAAACLFSNAVLLTAVATACSAFFRTTTSAFLWTYIVVACVPLMVIHGSLIKPFDFIITGGYLMRSILLASNEVLPGRFSAGSTATLLESCLSILAACIPTLLCAIVALLPARYWLVSRAFQRSTDRAGGAYSIMRPLQELCERLRLVRKLEKDTVPGASPIAWRESHRRWLGDWLPIWVAGFCSAILVVIQLNSPPPSTHHSYPPGIWNLCLWFATLVLLITETASLITKERLQETLPVLLTTPLPGRSILLGKLFAVQSLLWMFSLPLICCLALRIAMAIPVVRQFQGGEIAYPMALVNESFMILIYPQLTIWMALYFSLRSRTTVAAILKTIGLISAMCIVPWIILIIVATTTDAIHPKHYDLILALLLFGPANLLLYGYQMETLPPGSESAFWPIVMNSLIYSTLWWLLRCYCLENADRLLGRQRESTTPAPQAAQASTNAADPESPGVPPAEPQP